MAGSEQGVLSCRRVMAQNSEDGGPREAATRIPKSRGLYRLLGGLLVCLPLPVPVTQSGHLWITWERVQGSL